LWKLHLACSLPDGLEGDLGVGLELLDPQWSSLFCRGGHLLGAQGAGLVGVQVEPRGVLGQPSRQEEPQEADQGGPPAGALVEHRLWQSLVGHLEGAPGVHQGGGLGVHLEGALGGHQEEDQEAGRLLLLGGGQEGLIWRLELLLSPALISLALQAQHPRGCELGDSTGSPCYALAQLSRLLRGLQPGPSPWRNLSQ